MIRQIFLLGSTGSIGKNTIDLVQQHPDTFHIEALAANRNVDLLARQIEIVKPEYAVIFDREAFKIFTDKYRRLNVKVFCGREGIHEVLGAGTFNIFLNAFVGFSGLEPTLSAIMQGINIAIANKETLVVAGALVNKLAREKGIKILPIDSEHSAIWQCLAGEDKAMVKRLILTASGGPFRKKSRTELAQVTPAEALKHPNWNMGAKITIDSATMMNKGLEVIEAYWLYGLPTEKIEILIHPQSIIHSMVEFVDHSVKAQLGIPDMRIPILYALTYPDRLPLDVPPVDFHRIKRLEFEPPDYEKFPCLGLAFQAISEGKTYPAAMNAANEIAVEAFLQKTIRFTEIPQIIESVLDQHQPQIAENLEDYLAVDLAAREMAKELIKLKQNKR